MSLTLDQLPAELISSWCEFLRPKELLRVSRLSTSFRDITLNAISRSPALISAVTSTFFKHLEEAPLKLFLEACKEHNEQLHTLPLHLTINTFRMNNVLTPMLKMTATFLPKIERVSFIKSLDRRQFPCYPTLPASVKYLESEDPNIYLHPQLFTKATGLVHLQVSNAWLSLRLRDTPKCHMHEYFAAMALLLKWGGPEEEEVEKIKTMLNAVIQHYPQFVPAKLALAHLNDNQELLQETFTLDPTNKKTDDALELTFDKPCDIKIVDATTLWQVVQFFLEHDKNIDDLLGYYVNYWTHDLSHPTSLLNLTKLYEYLSEHRLRTDLQQEIFHTVSRHDPTDIHAIRLLRIKNLFQENRVHGMYRLKKWATFVLALPQGSKAVEHLGKCFDENFLTAEEKSVLLNHIQKDRCYSFHTDLIEIICSFTFSKMSI